MYMINETQNHEKLIIYFTCAYLIHIIVCQSMKEGNTTTSLNNFFIGSSKETVRQTIPLKIKSKMVSQTLVFCLIYCVYNFLVDAD